MRADALIKEGLDLRRAGRDADAIEKLQQAYDLTPSPRAAAQLGWCFQAIGRWSDADGRLSEALTASRDPWVHKNREVIKESLETVKAHVGRLEVMGDPPGAEVLVNGKPSGRLPLRAAIPVNEGLVDVELIATGFQRASRSVTIVGGGYQRLVLRLTPVALSATASTSASSDSPLSLSGSAEPTAQETPVYRRPWVWGLAIGVVAVATIGVFLAASRSDKAPPFDLQGELK